MLTQVPVVAASFGALAALLGVALTQFATSRRETKQWQRQLAQDETRWERERQERQDQWDREDAARWERERYSAYADLLASVEKWIDAARSEKPNPAVGRPYITETGVARLDEAHEGIERSEEMVELLAPESLRGRVRGIAVKTSFFTFKYGPVGESIDEAPSEDSDTALADITRAHLNLRSLIRKDLGIEPVGEDEES
ncbi:hypothetical protein [Pseudonocardia humida]|uniref:Uncharacterized protein n=1 Tax=Pseudonocardia humida TaxID=2800819 RepID=A0ABT1A8P5_9PSEU|nr:hypothetical protein [Pseudonocardia humida]MCO1659394.1 hypothetical protein [Pseudonocardia humida]